MSIQIKSDKSIKGAEAIILFQSTILKSYIVTSKINNKFILFKKLNDIIMF